VTTVWVYAEVRPEGPSPSALELLTRAREIGDEVAAVALGPGATASAPALGEHGASTVYVSDDPVYAETLGQPAAHALAEIAEAYGPDLILFSSSYDARDVAGRLQQKGIKARTVVLKLRYSDFRTITRQSRLSEAVDSAGQLSAAAGALLDKTAQPGDRFRLLGIQGANFQTKVEPQLRLWKP